MRCRKPFRMFISKGKYWKIAIKCLSLTPQFVIEDYKETYCVGSISEAKILRDWLDRFIKYYEVNRD